MFSEFQPEILNHHAAQMDVRRGVREPVFDARVNILGSLNLLEEAVAHKTGHILYIASAGAGYGEPKSMPVTEDYPINPITPYGISKHTVEHYLFTFSHLYGITYVVLRYGNVYGPRQSSQGEAGVFAVFSEQILAGIQPVIYGDGSKTRDYVYIDDVVQANVAALSRGYGEIFNIGSGIATTDKEIFSLILWVIGQARFAAALCGREAWRNSRYMSRHQQGWDRTQVDARDLIVGRGSPDRRIFQQTAQTIVRPLSG